MNESEPKSPKHHMPLPGRGDPKVGDQNTDKRAQLKDQAFMNQRSRVDTLQRKERARQDRPKPKGK